MALPNCPLTAQLRSYVAKFPAHTHFTVALSGGIDSVCLTHALHHLIPERIRAIHIHHSGGAPNDRMLQFCERWCLSLKIPLQTHRIAPPPERGNLEAHMRDQRYALLQQNATGPVLTAHHEQDLLESQLIYVAQGRFSALPNACQDMSQIRDGLRIYRPLLPIQKSLILTYAKHHDLEHIEDPSNQDMRFLRNRIRRYVMPHAAKDTHLSQLPLYCQLIARFHQVIRQHLIPHFCEGNAFVCPTGPTREVAFQVWFFQNTGFWLSLNHINDLLDRLVRARLDKNPHIRVGPYAIRRFQKKLYITPLTTQSHWEFSTISQHIEVCRRSKMPTPNPFSRQLKRLYQRHAIPPWLRDELPIFIKDGKIVAIWMLWVDKKSPPPRVCWQNAPHWIKNHHLPLSNSPYFQYNAFME